METRPHHRVWRIVCPSSKKSFTFVGSLFNAKCSYIFPLINSGKASLSNSGIIIPCECDMKYILYPCRGITIVTLFIISRYHKMYNQLVEEIIFLQKLVFTHFLQYNMNCIKIALKLLSTKIKQRVATYVYDSLCARKCKKFVFILEIIHPFIFCDFSNVHLP